MAKTKSNEIVQMAYLTEKSKGSKETKLIARLDYHNQRDEKGKYAALVKRGNQEQYNLPKVNRRETSKLKFTVVK